MKYLILDKIQPIITDYESRPKDLFFANYRIFHTVEEGLNMVEELKEWKNSLLNADPRLIFNFETWIERPNEFDPKNHTIALKICVSMKNKESIINKNGNN